MNGSPPSIVPLEALAEFETETEPTLARIAGPSIMPKLLLPAILLLALLGSTARSAETPLDEVSKQAAALETQLAKQRDTTPEAAPLMLELVNLYHANARVFGLIRVAEAFVAKQSSHPEHKAVMLKLIDGLEVMSRNKELSAAIRQFFIRYPNDPAAPRLEQVLAQALEQMGDRMRAAEAYGVVYTRQANTATGREAGAQAVRLYVSVNTAESFTHAAEVAEAMLDALPAGEFASEAGLQAVENRRRVSQWAKANAVGNKLLAKGLPQDKATQRQLHATMCENYEHLGQWANAVDSVRKARALGDRQDLHSRLIAEMHRAGAPPAEMEPVVNEYVQKYPDQLFGPRLPSRRGQAASPGDFGGVAAAGCFYQRQCRDVRPEQWQRAGAACSN